MLRLSSRVHPEDGRLRHTDRILMACGEDDVQAQALPEHHAHRDSGDVERHRRVARPFAARPHETRVRVAVRGLAGRRAGKVAR
jgi:hypothetical protein